MIFSIKRFWWMMESFYRLEIKSQAQHLLIFWLLSLLLQVLFVKDVESLHSLFAFFLILGSVFYTQGIFKDFHQQKSGVGLMMLPASILEKLLHRWVISFLNYSILFLLGYFVANLLASPISQWIDLPEVAFYNPFTLSMLTTIKCFAFFHSCYFLGAVYFSKTPFLKSTLSLMIFFLLVGIISLVVFVFLGVKNNATGSVFETFISMFYTIEKKIPGLRQFLSIFHWIFMPIFFYACCFFRFKETEDKD